MENFNFADAMKSVEMTIMAICPRCDELKDMTYPALSRKDNKTEICSQCGTEEALNDFAGRSK